MKKLIVLILLQSIFVTILVGQTADQKRNMHWYFGDFAGLDFTSGTAVADTNGQISTLESTAAISDTNGILQCYFGFGYQTNYDWCIYNREHKTMPNGCGLGNGNSTPNDCAVFIPKPGDDSTYYLFTVDGWENQFMRGLRWHEIDMRQDSGRGDVVSQDNVLFAPVCEQLAATRHANGCDYWVLAHERSNANFLAYKVTANGIDTVPVISTIGTDYSLPEALHWPCSGSALKFTPNGSIVAARVYWCWVITGIPEDIELFQFDNATGVLSNCINLPTNIVVTGIGFSSDNTKLYFEDGDSIARMFQWDLSIYDSLSIVNSKTDIHQSPFTIALDFALGIDNKLYLSNEFLQGIANPPFLSTIENPNASAANVIVLEGSVSTGSRGVSQGLPTMVSSFESNTMYSSCFVGVSENITPFQAPFYPNPANEFLHIASNFETVKLFNLLGEIILQNKNQKNINIKNVPNGIYILQLINTKKQISTYKLIINH